MALRFLFYTLLILLAGYALPWTIADGNVQEFTENHWVEWTQLGLLGVAALLWLQASRTVPMQELGLIIAGCYGIGMARELDAVLDRLVPVLGWKAPAGVLIVVTAFHLRARIGALGIQLRGFIGTAPFVLGWAGLMVAAPISQLIAHGPFLEAMLVDNYHRAYKHAIEESGELMGYLLLLAAAVEGWSMKQNGLRPPERSPEAG